MATVPAQRNSWYERWRDDSPAVPITEASRVPKTLTFGKAVLAALVANTLFAIAAALLYALVGSR